MGLAERLFNLIAGLASIAGLILYLFFEHPTKGWVGLAFVLVMVLFLGWQVWKAIKELLNLKYPKGHIRLASFARYTCLDGKTIEYSVHRVIQAKRPFLHTVEHGFKWSGSKRPQINCDPHKLANINYLDSEISYDAMRVELKNALLYNQVAVVPIRMTIDDSDQKSIPHVMIRVDEPSQLISWRIELGIEKDRTSMPARLMRKPLESQHDSGWQLITTVPYHPIKKSYETELIQPEFGYFYKVMWDR